VVEERLEKTARRETKLRMACGSSHRRSSSLDRVLVWTAQLKKALLSCSKQWLRKKLQRRTQTVK
jgi:hypothetical protein